MAFTHLFNILASLDPCSEFHCPEGYVCDYYEDFNKTYCDPTCDGGSYTCPDDKVCVAVSYLPCYYPPCVYIECHYHEPGMCVCVLVLAYVLTMCRGGIRLLYVCNSNSGTSLKGRL